MRDFIGLGYSDRRPDDDQWLTTADVARLLERTPDGVRWLARTGQLTYQQTHSGVRLFRRGTVRRFVQARAEARLQRRTERLAALRPQMLRVNCEPRQLVLDFSARLKLVGSRGKGRKVA